MNESQRSISVYENKNVVMRLTDFEDNVKVGTLELHKGPPHLLTWKPCTEDDSSLALVIDLSQLSSFSRVVPSCGTASYMTFTLRDNTRSWPLEFPQGGSRELIRAFQGLLEYKKAENNQYVVCQTSPDVVTRAMESLNLFEGASLEPLSLTGPPGHCPPRYPVPNYPSGHHRTGILQQAKDGAQKGIVTLGRYVREAMAGGDRPDFKASGIEVMTLEQLRNEDVSVYSTFREDCGFEVLSKKSSLPYVPRPKVVREMPVSMSKWMSHLDPHGRVTDVDTLLQRIYRGGVDHELRPIAWKYLLNYYVWSNTAEENTRLVQLKMEQYFAMKYQWKSLTEVQLQRNSIMRDRINQIDKDVKRTDRSMDFFKDEDGDNIRKLNDILMTYVMYNFDLGYVQGMSDLLSPILILMESEHDAFWCFAGLMDRVESNFEMDQAGMKKQLQQLSSLVQCLDEQLFEHLEVADSSNMYFAFRWLLLSFKREFPLTEAMRIFEVLWTDLPCRNFHLLVCLGILDGERDIILHQLRDLTSILKHINDISMQIDLERCLCVAEAMYLQMRACKDLPDDIADIFGLNSDSNTDAS